MSYIIEPMPLISFVEDTKMKLPRFQRKATWDNKQNFELCISVFQDYPVGVVIVNKEQSVSWLLDGRQRRNALKTMRDDPVSVYNWARSYVGFKKTEDAGEISRLYWDKVEKYLQKEDRGSENAEDDPDTYDDSEEETVESSFDSEKQKQGLKTLLDLVLMIHQIKNGISRWEKNFDYKDYCTNLKYQLKRENYRIDPVKLRAFLLDIYKSVPDITEEEFVTYYDDNSTLIEGKETSFKSEVNKRWDAIKKSIDIIARTEKIFEEARIGIITLTNVSPLDAQNIFSRVNKGGTQLKAEELLSAKPFWNELVNNVNFETQSLVKTMYKNLGVEEPNGVVKWDLAATLIYRIDKNHLIFDSSLDEDEISMEKVTLGFKLLSSIYVQGMSGKSVSELEKDNSINWNNDIDELVVDLNKICEILMNDGFFKYLQSWDRPILRLLGTAASLEFISILLLDWKSKGNPTVSGAQYKAFQRDARILFDRLVFEYSTKVWRGSGDSKMSADIKDWSNRLKSVEKGEWLNFVKGALNGVYNGQNMSQKTITPVLYYYYSLNSIAPSESSSSKIDVDHIIPQEKFSGNSMVNSSMKDSLANLALLPKSDNIAKSSKALNEITDSWLKDQITKYEGIEEKDFAKYSDITNIDDMKRLRGNMYIKTFDSVRESVLSN